MLNRPRWLRSARQGFPVTSSKNRAKPKRIEELMDSNVIPFPDFSERLERIEAECVADQLEHSSDLIDIRFARRIRETLQQ